MMAHFNFCPRDFLPEPVRQWGPRRATFKALRSMADANGHYGVWPHTIEHHVGVHGYEEPRCTGRPSDFWSYGPIAQAAPLNPG